MSTAMFVVLLVVGILALQVVIKGNCVMALTGNDFEIPVETITGVRKATPATT